jgi:hypothetical protein
MGGAGNPKVETMDNFMKHVIYQGKQYPVAERDTDLATGLPGYWLQVAKHHRMFVMEHACVEQSSSQANENITGSRSCVKQTQV